MASKKFTEDEMSRLRANPYVLKVSPNIVHFSAEFKKRFWELLQTEKSSYEIVAELGVDPDILGVTRIDGLKSMICKDVRDGKGFKDLETYGKYLDEYTSPEYKIKRLEQKLEYKDQEIEFLKKIVSLGREGTEK